MNSKDITRIVGYVAGLGTLVTGQAISQILAAFYVPQPYITVSISVIGGVITLATLIYSVIQKPTLPTGYSAVITPNATTPISDPALLPTLPLTTADAVKKGP